MTNKFKLTGLDKINIKIFNETGNTDYCEKTIDRFKALYQQLKDELGYEPTSRDLDRCLYTPSSKLLQRYFDDGVVGFRKFIGLENSDLTKGSGRSRQMTEVFHSSKKYEMDLFMEIYEKLNNDEVSVIREYCYQQWQDEKKLVYHHGNFSDVAIITGDHVQLFDFTCPANIENLAGCVRIKINKLAKQPIAFRPEVTYEIYFVCVNPSITQEQIDNMKISKNTITVYSLDSFRAKFL